MDIFTVLFYQPIFNLMVILYRLFSENLGLAIIIIALLSRLITLPITLRQMKMMKSNKEFSDKMKEVKSKYKNNKEKQQEEMMKLQSEYLPAQLSGCLPAILQFILFINVYNVINNIIAQGVESFNVVAYPFVSTFEQGYTLNTSFFNIFDLKTSAASIGLNNPQVIPYLILILLVGVTQFYSTRLMTPKSDEEDKIDKDKGKKTAKEEEKSEDFGEIFQQSTKQTMLLFPIMVALLSYNFAAGLSLYWIAQSSFVIIQQFIFKLVRKDP